MNKEKKELIEKIKTLSKGTLLEAFQIECLEIGNDFLILKMPLDQKLSRPGGFLHGGASLALAESTASLLSYLEIDNQIEEVLGLEVSANHIQSKKIENNTFLFAKAKFLHKGKKTHLVSIKIYDENKKTLSICKMTNLVLEKMKP